MRRAALTYLLIALAGAAIVSLATAFIIGIHPFAEARWGFHTPARFCSELVADAQLRGAVAGGLMLTAIVVHLALAAAAWHRSTRKVEELTSLLDALPRVEPSGCLAETLAATGTELSTTVIDSGEAFAFTAGHREPRIYLSRAAVESLHDDELEAVLRHEEHHRLAGDPLRVQRLLLLKSALGYLPATKRLVRAYLHQAEYAADDAALREVKPRSVLNAFVKLAEASVPVAGAAGYTDFAEARIARLTSRREPATLEWATHLTAFAASVMLLVSLPLLSLALTELHPVSALLP